MILFLNKCDIFADKVTTVPLTVCFADYKGEQTYDACSKYIEQQFQARNHQSDGKNETKKIYTHVTCATDKNNVHMVFNAVKDIIIRGSLEAAGLIS